MKHCAVCKFDSREPIVYLPAIVAELRLRGERVGVKVPPEDDMHVSCILKLRDKIVAKEAKYAPLSRP